MCSEHADRDANAGLGRSISRSRRIGEKLITQFYKAALQETSWATTLANCAQLLDCSHTQLFASLGSSSPVWLMTSEPGVVDCRVVTQRDFGDLTRSARAGDANLLMSSYFEDESTWVIFARSQRTPTLAHDRQLADDIASSLPHALRAIKVLGALQQQAPFETAFRSIIDQLPTAF